MDVSDSPQPVILVTGGHGFLGSRVVPLLAQNYPSAEIFLVTRREKQNHKADARTKTVIGDLRDERVWQHLPPTITHVIHLAAAIPRGHEYAPDVWTRNVLPLTHLATQGRRWPRLRQIIYSSTVSVYGQSGDLLTEDSPCHPSSSYGQAKLEGEGLLRSLEAQGVDTVSLRLSSLYGYGQYQESVLPIMVNRALKKQEIVVFGDGNRTQDFLSCDDGARAVFLSFQKQARGIYNIGSGTPVTMAELARTASRVFSEGASKVVFNAKKSDNDLGIKLDIGKGRRELDYEPEYQLEAGLRRLKEEILRAR